MGRQVDGDDVLFGGYVPPSKKAIALATITAIKATGTKINQMELIWKGVSHYARMFGILDKKDNVTKDWSDTVKLIEQQIREKRDQERARNVAAKKARKTK